MFIMKRVQFIARGHHNIVGEHRTTLEITTEDFLTTKGTCIVGVNAETNLLSLDEDIKALAKAPSTRIILRLRVGEIIEEIEGRGSPGLSYRDGVSMVIRTSDYECDRTVMVGANKAASDLSRIFINSVNREDVKIECELEYITQ
jgi:hypothetical protein